MTDFLASLGNAARDPFWTPVLAWTLLALVAMAAIALVPRREVFLKRDLHFALLLALPAGLIAARWLGSVPGAGVLRSWWAEPAPLAPIASFVLLDAPLFEPNPVGTVFPGDPHVDPAADPAIWFGVATVIAVAACLAALSAMVISGLRLRRLLRLARPDGTVILSGDRRVHVLRSDDAHVPFTCGVIRPRIVLPTSLAEDREVVLAHEAMHHEHSDVIRLWTMGLVQAAFAFHPLAHLVSSRLSWLMEAACDRATMERTGLAAASYGEVLLRSVPRSAPRALWALPMGRSLRELRSRIVALGHASAPARRGPVVAVYTLTVFLVGMMTVAAAGVTVDQEGIVGGRVTRADTGETLPGASVFVAGTNLGGASGPNGEYVIHGVPAGKQEIVASYVGFVPTAQRDVNVLDGGTVRLNFALNPQTYPASGVTVTAPLPSPPVADLPPPPPPPASDPEEPGEVFVIVEDMPELIGGLDGLQEKVVYPEIARRSGIEGRVIVQFLVRPDGSVTNPVIVRGIGGGCDEEALRVVSGARFKPGTQRGRAVTVKMSVPITFRLIRGFEREMEITVDEEGVIRLDGRPSSLDDIRALENLDWSKTRLTILGWENTPPDVLRRVKSVVAGFANGHVQPVTGTIMGMNSRKDVETTPRLDPPRNAPAGERHRIVLDVSPTGVLTMNGATILPSDIPGTIDWKNHDVLLRWLNPGSSEQAAITYSLVYEKLRNAGINPSTQIGNRYNDRSGRSSQGTESRQDVDLDRAVSPPPGDSEREVFVIVESMPELIGGLDGLQEKVVYPELAAKAGVQGRVIVQFLVEPDGSVSNPVVVRGIGAGCDEEALRVVQTAKFTPGRQRGVAVPVRMSLPITFKLDHGAETPSVAIEIRADGSLLVNGMPTTLEDLSKRTDIDWANSVVSFRPEPGAPPEMIERVREFLRTPPGRR